MSLTNKEMAEVRNLINVRTIVRRSENPHPVIIAIIVIGILFTIYFMYNYLLKKSIQKNWHDNSGANHTIMHNKWRDFIVVDEQYSGLVNNGLILVRMEGRLQMGVISRNIIDWMNGDTWYDSLVYPQSKSVP